VLLCVDELGYLKALHRPDNLGLITWRGRNFLFSTRE